MKLKNLLKEAQNDLGQKYLDAMSSAKVFDKNSEFVTIDNSKNVTKYANLAQLKAAMDKMPKIGFESAEDDLTQSDVNKARQLFQHVKSKLDGTKDYQLVARVSPKEDMNNEFYIWSISKAVEEVSKALHEGAILNAITPRLEGEVKAAVAALEKELQSTGAILDYEHADRLADCIIDIIDAAKQEANDEYAD
jgi:hypothetical protein